MNFGTLSEKKGKRKKNTTANTTVSILYFIHVTTMSSHKFIPQLNRRATIAIRKKYVVVLIYYITLQTEKVYLLIKKKQYISQKKLEQINLIEIIAFKCVIFL